MPSGESSVIRCYAKLRPTLPSESVRANIKINGDKIATHIEGVEATYVFDGVYGPEVKSRLVYKEKCEPLLHRVVEGTNVAIVTMGKTGAGKSYFMNGLEGDLGIAPCMINGLFQVIERMKNKEFFVTAQYLEVMDNDFTDLLNPHSGSIKVRQTPNHNTYLDGLSALVVEDSAQLLQYYEQGTRARKMGSSEAKTHRERSTAIFMINVEQKEPGKSSIGLKSCLSFVDLADIENNTCKGLLACLHSLSEKQSHVPYRDSKLSRVLQDTFGGNCLTSVFALLHPHGNDNAKALKVSQTIRNIKQNVSINMDDTENTISNLRDEISTVREKVTQTSNREDVMVLQDLVTQLQTAKQQTWAEKQRLSTKYEQERKSNLANRGILEWVMDSKQKDQQQIQERVLMLQKEKEQLSNEYKANREQVIDMKEQLQKHITDFSKISESDKVSDADRKARVDAIHRLKERLKELSDTQKSLKLSLQDVTERLRSEREEASSTALATKGSLTMSWMIEAEERQKIEAENAIMVSDEMERKKLEIEQDKADIKLRAAEGKTHSAQEYAELETKIAELEHDKPVTSLQIQVLKQEKAKLQSAIDEMYKQFNVELEKQQMQHFQTFRNYREVFDKQKMALEKRYRELLDDSIQDAVFLSSRNNELMEENANLRKETAGLNDALSMAGGK